MPSKIVFGVLGDAPLKGEIIEDALTDWINDVADEMDDAETATTTGYLPASRTHTTPAVRAIADWLGEDPDAEIIAVAATAPGVHGKELAAKASETISVAAAEIDDEMIERLRVSTQSGDALVFLILLWEPGEEREDLEELAELAAEAGIAVKALHSTGMDTLQGGPDDEPDADNAEEPEPPHQVTIEEAIADEAQADEAGLSSAQVADVIGTTIGRLFADAGEALYKAIGIIVSERVEAAMEQRDTPTVREIVRGEVADEPAEKPAEPRRRGRARTTREQPQAEEMIAVLKKPDGTYELPEKGRRGRLRAGWEKTDIPRSQAEELGLL